MRAIFFNKIIKKKKLFSVFRFRKQQGQCDVNFVNINKASSKVVLKIAKSLSKMPNFVDIQNILMCLLITLNKKYKHVRLRKKCEQHEAEYYLNS